MKHAWGLVAFLFLAACPGRVAAEGEGDVGEGEGDVGEGEGDVGEGEGDVGEGEGDVGEGEGEGATFCPTARVDCFGVCVDVRRDEDNCGVCGLVCDVGDVCSNGRCTTPCANPHFDADEVIGNSPELLIGTHARFDADGDGAIDDVVGVNIVRTTPTFHTEPSGLVAQSGQFELDPAPGLENLLSDCTVRSESPRVVRFTPPAGLTCRTVPTDIDHDGDYDVVTIAGRVFTIEDGVWGERDPIPEPPGLVTAVEWGGQHVLVAVDGSHLLMHDGAEWLTIANVRFFGGSTLRAARTATGDDDVLLDQGSSQRPSILRCHRPVDGRSSCNVDITVSPGPSATANDRYLVGFDSAQDLIERRGASADVISQIPIAVDDDAAYFLDSDGDVSRRAFSSSRFALFAAAMLDGQRVPVSVEGETFFVDSVAHPLPAGSYVQLIVEPQRPVAWLVVAPFPSSVSSVRAVDLVTGELLLDAPAALTFNNAPAPAFFDVDGDGGLDLVAGGVVVDTASGDVLDDSAAIYGDVDGDGFVEDVTTACAGSDAVAAFDTDGDGVDDIITFIGFCRGGDGPLFEEPMGEQPFRFFPAGVDVDGDGGLEVERRIDGRTRLVSPSVELDVGEFLSGPLSRGADFITWTGEGRTTENRPLLCD